MLWLGQTLTKILFRNRRKIWIIFSCKEYLDLLSFMTKRVFYNFRIEFLTFFLVLFEPFLALLLLPTFSNFSACSTNKSSSLVKKSLKQWLFYLSYFSQHYKNTFTLYLAVATMSLLQCCCHKLNKETLLNLNNLIIFVLNYVLLLHWRQMVPLQFIINDTFIVTMF